MNRTFVLGCTLALAVGARNAADAQTPRADSAAAVSAVEQFHAAIGAADSVRAVSWLAEDVMIMESGVIQTRADYLGGHLRADMKGGQSSKSERTVMKVSIVGSAAYVVAKTVTPPSGAQGSTGSELAELMVLSSTAGGWKIRAIHWSSRRRKA